MTSPIPSPATPDCCAEFARATGVSRRGFLQGVGAAGLSYAVGSAVVTVAGASSAAADGVGGNGVLVVLSMRGAADGLSLVVPHGDPIYYKARPTIAIPSEKLLAKDAFFGLHPALAPLVPMWSAGTMAAVHATGMQVPNRSHFAAMEVVEDADPGSSERVGWLNRLIGELPGESPLQGLALGAEAPTSMFGPQPTMGFASLDKAVIAGADSQTDPNDPRMKSMAAMWRRTRSPLKESVQSSMAAVGQLTAVRKSADTSASYPNSDLGKALSSIARTLRGNVGVSVVTVDQGDWDMHSSLGTLQWGRMIDNADDFAKSVAAFFNDLGPLADQVTLVTLSEFGRRVVENSNAGLDHGWGNVMFLFGAGVKGGYFGNWPGLSNTLDADLTVTTDYRSVLAEVVERRTGASAAKVFPGGPSARVGAMRTT
ncbi:DUF1501 domain-containing protein [Nocardioides acrostichi]|uniref:DUF1501 domain-containing protein n=1 Tax=Nocardioides acrostichi TaxID=2784339 RepID=A0A930V0C5_9ACTN|nr:DUF1501 domain-containing protein [Nocardioides acrostichi]MBF4161699.1 DUF1501 domain-containing protein [Nocardioides acrostichi]